MRSQNLRIAKRDPNWAANNPSCKPPRKGDMANLVKMATASTIRAQVYGACLADHTIHAECESGGVCIWWTVRTLQSVTQSRPNESWNFINSVFTVMYHSSWIVRRPLRLPGACQRPSRVCVLLHLALTYAGRILKMISSCSERLQVDLKINHKTVTTYSLGDLHLSARRCSSFMVLNLQTQRMQLWPHIRIFLAHSCSAL